MINGLGIGNHSLYLMPEFFADKPVECLVGTGINQAGIPLVMQALDGNNSDKNSFTEAVNTHVGQL